MLRRMSHSVRFRACASAYAALCGPFVLLALLWVVAAAKSGSLEWDALGVCLGIATAWAVWLARFRLELGDEAFSYQSLLRRRRTVPYAAVAGFEVTARGPASKTPLGAAIRLTDGSRIPINFKVFPREAGSLLLERIDK